MGGSPPQSTLKTRNEITEHLTTPLFPVLTLHLEENWSLLPEEWVRLQQSVVQGQLALTTYVLIKTTLLQSTL